MSDEQETSSLTLKELKGYNATPLPSVILRQQAGLHPVGSPKGTRIEKPSAEKIQEILEKQKRIKQAIKSGEPPKEKLTKEEINLLELHRWLNPEETEDFPLLRMSEVATIGDLVAFGREIRKTVDEWLNQKRGRQSLASFLKKGPLVSEVILSLEKIQILLELEGLDPSLIKSLETLQAFYFKDLVPLFNLTEEELEKLITEAKNKLEQKKDEKKKVIKRKLKGF